MALFAMRILLMFSVAASVVRAWCEDYVMDAEKSLRATARGLVEGCTQLKSVFIPWGVDIEFLKWLESAESITFDFSSLSSLSWLANLKTVGTLQITNNPHLLSLTGLENLASVRTLQIANNLRLGSLEALQSLTSLDTLQIEENSALNTFHGLQLTRVNDTFRVAGNAELTSLSGLARLTSVHTFQVADNPKLESLMGISNIPRIETLEIANNPSLESLHGLGTLVSAGSVRVLNNNQLTSLDGLEQLFLVGDLNLTGNANLRSLAGLQGLAAVTDIIIEDCALSSLHGLGALETLRGQLRVSQSTPMQVLGAPVAPGASIAKVVIDESAWPQCVSIHERFVLLNAKDLTADQDWSIPDASPEEWWQEHCDRTFVQPVHCVAPVGLHPCAVSLGQRPDSALESFFLADSTGCGVCPEEHLQIKATSEGVVELFGVLQGANLGFLSVCLCRTDRPREPGGPVADLYLHGPRTSSASQVCIGNLECTLRLEGSGLQRTDLVVLTRTTCSSTGINSGFPARWVAGSDNESEYIVDASRWGEAPPDAFKVCWSASCALDPENVTCGYLQGAFLDVGAVVQKASLYPSVHERILGQESLVVPNSGFGVSDGDVMRVMRTCGQSNWDGLVMLRAISQNLLFDFGELRQDRVLSGTHHLCWCRPSGNSTCTREDHFATKVGELSLFCPANQEPRSGRCESCPAGRAKSEVGNVMCSECPLGKFSLGDGEACEWCPAGRVAAEAGRSACDVCRNWETSSVGAECRAAPEMLALLALFSVSVGAFCSLLVQVIARRFSVADVSPEQGHTIVTTRRRHGFSNFGRPSFPVTFSETGHPGLDRPSQPFRVTVKDTARLELLTRDGRPISDRLDTSMGVLMVPFPYDLYHQGWPVSLVIVMPILLIGVVAIGTLVSGAGLMADAALVAVAAALACMAASAGMRRGGGGTPLARRLLEFKQELTEQNAIQAISCEKGPNRALSVGKLHDLLEFFREFIRDRNAYYLTSNILVPVTKETELSYAEFIGPGQVQWFVSHFWGTSFEHFCTALQKHAESVSSEDEWKRLRYWVCFCSNNQHRIEEELGDGWQESSFYVTLKSGHCKGTCMVLDDKALPLTRVWCIFELMQTVKLQRSQEHFRGLLLCTSSGVLNTGGGSVAVAIALARRVANMDLRAAQASSEEDARMIRDQVIQEMGSFSALNVFICTEVRDMLVRAQYCSNQQFDDVFRLLDPVVVDV